MKASVVVCTFNRASLLRDTIQAVIAQDFASGPYEIIVVDNNSSDETPRVVAQAAAASAVPVRYVFEAAQGLSMARNAGIRAAAGDVVVFVDDDIDAKRDWLSALVAPFSDVRVACTGGPIRPIWPRDKPDWLTPDWEGYLGISEFESARATGEFAAPEYPWGLNIAFDRRVVFDLGMFPTDLGRIGSSLRSNEEVSVCRRIVDAGKRIRFAPTAVVYHRIHPERLKKQWFYHRTYHQGRSNAVLDRRTPAGPYARLRALAASMFWARMHGDHHGFDRTCREHLSIGYVSGAIGVGEHDGEQWRLLRGLKTFVAALLDTSAKVAADRQRHIENAEAMVRQRDGWLANRDAQIAERDRRFVELERLSLERQATIDQMTENSRVLTGDRDSWRAQAEEHQRAIEKQSASIEEMQRSYGELETDRDNWRRVALEREQRLETQDVTAAELRASQEELTRSRGELTRSRDELRSSLQQLESDRNRWQRQAEGCESTIARLEGALWHRIGVRLGLVEASRPPHHSAGHPD